MCVIFCATKTRPTKEMIEQAFKANNAGAGIAWREDEFVRWEKGLDEKQITELCATAPLPFVAHFRIPTVGGALPELCHPFPIDRAAPTDLSGKTKGLVLFHNGHWTDWKKMCLEAVVRKNTKLPGDKWSDSRAMAWFAAQYGLGALDMIDEKCVVFGPNGMKFLREVKDFTLVNEIYCSNTHWQYRNNNSDYYGGRYLGQLCRETSCYAAKLQGTDYCKDHQPAKEKDKKLGGASQEAPFCTDGEVVSGEKDKQEAVQESKEEVRAGVEGPKEAHVMVLTETSVGNELVKWVRSLNPKKLKAGVDTDIRLSRVADASKGIQHVGPL